MNRADWLQARKSLITATDVPAILGVSPYRTPLQVWFEKVSDEQQPDSEILEIGRDIEPVIARKTESRLKR